MRNKSKYILGIDCETTGLCFKNISNRENPVFNPQTGERHQAVSWGLAIVDTETFKPVETLYIEVKWNSESVKQRKNDPQFGKKAEEVHGLTQQYLEENGVTEEQVVIAIGSLLTKYFGADIPIKLLGHNVHLFDLEFLRDLFYRFDIPIRFANRHIDTFSIGVATCDTWNSDDLFEFFGFEPRKDHNALDDVLMSIEIVRMIRTIFKNILKD